ncbi:MAG TPA: hypothetical protein VFM99_11315 [Chitinophagales bacterium]|nr:hypothetical protein [Chitinophagales bacterium]
MKTPGKNSKKQGPSDTHGSKASTLNKKSVNQGKGPWKDPDPTNPKKSPEKVNEPYAKTNASITGEKAKSKPVAEKITNAGESEHHIPVNKSDYETFEDEYEDFELEDENEDDDFDEDEDGETDSNYNYEEEEDESRQFRSQVRSPEQRKKNEQTRLPNEQNKSKIENNNQKSPLLSNTNKRKNNGPQG